MKFAICIGHSRLVGQDGKKTEGGAVSVGKVSEHSFNSGVGQLLVRELTALGHSAFIFARYQGAGYPMAMRWLGGRMNVSQPRYDVALELHFNSSDDMASHGHEYLYFKGSKEGELLARSLADAHKVWYPGSRARQDNGVLASRPGDRGYQFLRNVPPTAVIAEPFFGSNPEEWATYASDPEKLAKCYAVGLHTFAGVA